MEDQRTMQKIMDLIRVFSIFFVIIDAYWVAYPLWRELGFYHDLSDKLIHNLNASTGILDNPWITKFTSLICLAIS